MEGYQREGAEVHPAWALRGLALVAAHDGRLDDARAWATEGARRASGARRRRRRAVPPPHPRVRRAHDGRVGGGRCRAHDGRGDGRPDGRPPSGPLQVRRRPGRGGARAGRRRAGGGGRRAAGRGRPGRADAWVVAVGARSAALRRGGSRANSMRRCDLLTRRSGADRLPMPFERGRTLLAKGRLHRRRKEKRLADETLREALACFESLGARTGPRSRGRSSVASAAGRRPRGAHGDRAPGRRARRHRPHQPRDRRAGVPRPEDRRQRPRPGVQKLGIHSRAELGALMATEANAPAPD